MPVKEAISLFELNRKVREVLYDGLPSSIWIIGEISQFNENRSGHCYLEIIDKDPDNDSIIASSRATIWASRYRMIKPYFETTTGQALTEGIKIMISVKVEYHERYGLSLNILDIEPSFTLGDLARRRMEIISQLEKAGVISMNKELELPLVPQKIAVISSETAAGYGDFIDQINSNAAGYKYYTKLFPAIMQGSETGKSIIEALDKIAATEFPFDIVVIIRGGGAKTDLSSFDDFDLAYYITQFPIPVISGIGHERDESVVDLVAHTSSKTPTAVAEFIIQQADYFISELDELRNGILESSREQLIDRKDELVNIIHKLKTAGDKLLSIEKMSLRESALRGSNATGRYIHVRQNVLNANILNFKASAMRFIDNKKQLLSNQITSNKRSVFDLINSEKNRLNMLKQGADLQNPERILKRGYSLTLLEGKVLKNLKDVHPGKQITTKLSDGSFSSRVLPDEKT